MSNKLEALKLALVAHAGATKEVVLDSARHFYNFLEGNDSPPAAEAPKVKPATAKKATAAPAADATLAGTATAPATSTGTANSAPAAAAAGPTTVAPPADIQSAANSLKALVQDTAPGRGRAVAVALLAEFGGTQLAQIPAAKLAEFKRRCDEAGKTAPAASGADDLLGGAPAGSSDLLA